VKAKRARATLETARYFVDEDIAGLGLALRGLRYDVIVGGHPPANELVPKDDPDWIPVVAQRGWVVITNDRHIRTRPTEAPLAIEHRLRCACLRPRGKNPSQWDFMVLLMKRWSSIEELHARTGPVWLQIDDRYAPKVWRYEPGRAPRSSF